MPDHDSVDTTPIFAEARARFATRQGGDTMTEHEQRVLDAALDWWRGKAHVSWDDAEHLKHPTCNTSSARELKLAAAVADWLEDDTEPPGYDKAVGG